MLIKDPSWPMRMHEINIITSPAAISTKLTMLTNQNEWYTQVT